uniref:Vitellogenin n=1 Tax=Panagrolaimus sp. ES5 TaxID=591445 RepID=A0AC34FD88_9BILA
MNESAKAYGGWTPGCTLTSLMIAMKQFFADHDHHSNDKFQCEAKIVVERSKKYKCKECDATASDLFDENSCGKNLKLDINSNNPEMVDKQLSLPYQRALRELVCPVLARSPLEDEKMLIGFPIDVKYFNKISSVTTRQPRVGSVEAAMIALNITFKADDEKRIRQIKMVNAQLFAEFLSLEAYCTDLTIRGSTVDNLNGIQLRSSMGNRYTHIVPIYLSQAHISEQYK